MKFIYFGSIEWCDNNTIENSLSLFYSSILLIHRPDFFVCVFCFVYRIFWEKKINSLPTIKFQYYPMQSSECNCSETEPNSTAIFINKLKKYQKYLQTKERIFFNNILKQKILVFFIYIFPRCIS